MAAIAQMILRAAVTDLPGQALLPLEGSGRPMQPDTRPNEIWQASPAWRAGWIANAERLTPSHNPHHPAQDHQAYADWRDGFWARNENGWSFVRHVDDAFGVAR